MTPPDPRITPAVVQAAAEEFERYGTTESIIAAALAQIDKERPEPTDAEVEAVDREYWYVLATEEQWPSTFITPASKSRLAAMRRALAVRDGRS